jgi:hypothetical protein
MRIRQVRPEFWTDETLAELPDSARLFYIGLWAVADDDGWIEWQPRRIGALLYPYRTAQRRERDVAAWSELLVKDGRLRLLECGCGHIPTLPRHQKIGGRRTSLNADRHFSTHASGRVHTGMAVTLSNVTVGNGTREDARSFKESFEAAGGKAPGGRRHDA